MKIVRQQKIKPLINRRIQLIGQIDDERQHYLFDELSRLEFDASGPIEIELTSEGGYADNAFAIVGRLRQSPCEVIVTGYGVIASAAVIILAAGNYRRLARDSRVMVHEDSGKIKGTVSNMEQAILAFRAEEHKWNSRMASYTGTPAYHWAKLHKQGDTFLTPETCAELGMVDEII